MIHHERSKRADNMSEHLGGIKNSLKHALALVGIIIITLSLSGCDNFVGTDVSAETISTKQPVSETTAPDNQEETVSVTEFVITDWTMKDLVSEINICGQQINFPFKVEELNIDFNLSDKGYYLESSNTTGFIMYYKGEQIAYVYSDGKCSDKTEALFTNISFGMFNSVPEINIMGISNNSNYNYIVKKLGEPNYIQNDINTLRYIFSDNNYVIIHFEDDTQNAINFFSINYMEE